MARRVRDSAVVITGASSGIGRATALAFARRGARLALAARREQALTDLASECEAAGARAIAVPTDVTDEAAVQALARRTIEEFGRIDVWVNNAAVSLFARFEDAPPADYRRVIETDLFGYIHGARAALPHFRAQGSGVLVNVSSVAGRIGQPYTSAYVTSKWAVRGLSESLRQELLDAKDVHVCTVLPASIDTPLFQHAANYTGRAVKPLKPVYEAGQVADAIVELVESPTRERMVGAAGKAQSWFHTLAPGLAERGFARQVDRSHFQDAPADATPGNLFTPMNETTTVSGGWREDGRRIAPAAAIVAIAAIPAVVAWSRRRR